MAQGAITVQGDVALLKAFKGMEKDIAKNLTKRLKKAAEPAAAEGQRLMLGNITNMPASPRWAGMRIGVSRRAGEVYMVPKAKRGGGSGRSNLSGLMGPLMELAVEQKAADIEDALTDLIDDVADSHGF